MPTVTKTYVFLSDAEGWTLNPGGFWTGSDGDPAPGCLEIARDIFGTIFGNGTHLIGATWEDLGVPASATPTLVRGEFHYRRHAENGTDPHEVTSTILITDDLLGTIINLFPVDITTGLDNWQTFTGIDKAIPAPMQTSGRSFVISWGNSSVGGNGTGWQSFVDTISITVTYSGAPVDIFTDARSASETSAHVTVQNAAALLEARSASEGTALASIQNAVSEFTARAVTEGASRASLYDAASPVGGGGVIKARSAGVIAHVLLFDFCETAIEVYLAGAENADDLAATAYSAPTVFTLPTTTLPGHNYILQLPATDLAKFASGRLGFVKFRYAGNGMRECAGDVVIGGIEIIYNEKAVT